MSRGRPVGRLSVPGKIIAQHHAAPGGAVIGQQAIGQIQYDIALVGSRGRASAPNPRSGTRGHRRTRRTGRAADRHWPPSTATRSRTSDITLARPRALVFVDRRCAAQDMARQAGVALLSEMTTQGSLQRCHRGTRSAPRRAHSALASEKALAPVVSLAAAADLRSRDRNSRNGPAPWCPTTAPRRGGDRAGRSGRRAGWRPPVKLAPTDRVTIKAATGAIFAAGPAGRTLSCSCDLLTKLAEGTPHRTNETAVALR